MLPAEIEPFADHHIEALKEVRNELIEQFNNSTPDSEFTPERLDQMLTKLDGASRALYRFRQCMTDEHKMKARLEEARYNCRLNHR